LRDLLLARMGSASQGDASPEIRARMAHHAQQFSVAELLRSIRLFQGAFNETRASWQPSLPLEMAFVGCLNQVENPAKDMAVTPLNQDHKAEPAPLAAQPSVSTPAQLVEQVAPAPVGSSGIQELTFQVILDHWKLVLAWIGQRNPQTKALLNSCKPYGLKEGSLFLSFSSDTLKSKMEKEETLTLTEQGLFQVLGHEVRVRCFVSTGQKGSMPPEVSSEGMVATALRDLGGEIVDVQ
jgi:DNA polymerase III gamma/tau subunit